MARSAPYSLHLGAAQAFRAPRSMNDSAALVTPPYPGSAAIESDRRQVLSRFEVAAICSLLVIAAFLRLHRLGALSLQVDEGVQALAVDGWLQHGLPILPSGAVYQRAISFVGLQVASARMFGLDEFALRLPAALFGVGAVLVVFVLGRALCDRRVAWGAAIFIALSAWEIEMSRYARFYTAFQVCYGLAFLSFFKAVTSKAARWWWAFAGFSLAAFTLHELSLALVFCFLIPLFDRAATPRQRFLHLGGAVGFATAWLAYRRLAGPLLAAQAPPHGLLPAASAGETVSEGVRLVRGLPPIYLPDLSALQEAASDFSPGFVLIVALAAVSIGYIIRSDGIHHWARAALLVLAILLGVAHQFMAAGLVVVAWLGWFATGGRKPWSRPLLIVYAFLAAALLAWTVMLRQYPGESWKELVLSLFGFPNLLQHFVYWFALGWPLLLVAVVLAGPAVFRRYLQTENPAFLYLVAGIVMPVAAASMFSSYQESRYVFHLYLFLAILFVWGLFRVSDTLTSRGLLQRSRLAVVAAGFLLSSDIGPRTWAPLIRDYGSHRDRMRSVISWTAYAGFHQDQAGPAIQVRERAGTGDEIAAIGVPHQYNVYRYYAGRLDVVLGRPGDTDYQRRRDGKIVDWVTGAEVVWDADELAARLQGRTGWLLSDDVILRDDVDYFPEGQKLAALRIAGDTTVRGRDGVTVGVRLH